MAKWIICDYIHPQYGDVFKEWYDRLQKPERAKLDQKMDALAEHGLALIPGVVAPTGVASIFKLRARGRVQLRPLFCEGPGKDAFTFLLGAFEVQWEWEPSDAPNIAARYREDLLTDPVKKAKTNERFNRKTQK